MRIPLLLLFIGLLFVSVVHAQEAKVTINIKNKPVNDVFNEIKSQTPYSFWFDVKDVDTKRLVSVDVKNETAKNVLKSVLSGQDVDFKMNGNHIIISKKKPAATNIQTRQVTDSIVIHMVNLTGIVTDTQGEPLPGVAVILDGSIYGTFTDVDGKYNLKIPKSTRPSSDILFTLMSMKTVRMPYDNRIAMDVAMEEDSKKLREVEIISDGYQNKGRYDMVGAVSTLKASDIMMPAYSSIDQMLQGQVAGMVVLNSSNRPGASPNISIRGTATILGNTSPVWVVDGVIQPDVPAMEGATSALFGEQDGDQTSLNQFIGSQISWLNPNDIENITVLKDASATAIYGSKASNGVIVITTKKGKSDRLSVNYRANMTIDVRPRYSDYYLMNSKERVNFSDEAFNAGVNYLKVPVKQFNTFEGLKRMYLEGDITIDQYREQYNYLETENTDWLKILTRDAVSHNHNISISGGSQKSTYNASLSYYNKQGTAKGNDTERYSARLRVGFDLSPTIKVDMSISGTMSKTDGFIGGINPLTYAVNTSRAIPAYDTNGNPLYYLRSESYKYNTNSIDNLSFNILNELDNSYSQIKTPLLNANMNFSWQILSELSYQFVGGYQNSSQNTETYAGERTFRVARYYRGYDFGTKLSTDPDYKAAMLPFGGELTNNNSQTEAYNIQNKLLFSKTFDKSHRINAMAAWEVSSSKNVAKLNTVWGFMKDRGEKLATPTPIQDLVPIGAAKPDDWGILQDIYNSRWNSTNVTNNTVSGFATLAYSYQGRYVFNANFRSDASNRFGQETNNRFNPTYSFGAAWRPSEEQFMESTKNWLDYLTVRLTYGIQGNALTSQTPEMTLIQGQPSVVYGQYESTISKLANPYLDWEKTNTWNVGLDFILFNSKLSAVFEYYGRRSSPVSSIYYTPEMGQGLSKTYSGNGARVDNHGLEGTITYTAVNNKNWSFSTSFNFSKNWNKLSKAVLINDNRNTNHYINGQTTRMLETNFPVGAFWAYKFNGIDPETGYPTFLDIDGEKTDYIDFLAYAGNKNPSITSGINLRLRYKNVSLSSQFAAILGHKMFLQNPYSSFSFGQIPEPYTNLSKELLDRWKISGDERYTNIPGLYTGAASAISIADPSGQTASMYDMWGTSTARVVSGSFLRCRDITLNWVVKSQILTNIGVRDLSLSGSVNNIFVIASSKFNGMDPELQTSVMPRTVSFSLNVSF